jgi:hypothetical protein
VSDLTWTGLFSLHASSMKPVILNCPTWPLYSQVALLSDKMNLYPLWPNFWRALPIDGDPDRDSFFAVPYLPSGRSAAEPAALLLSLNHGR